MSIISGLSQLNVWGYPWYAESCCQPCFSSIKRHRSALADIDAERERKMQRPPTDRTLYMQFDQASDARPFPTVFEPIDVYVCGKFSMSTLPYLCHGSSLRFCAILDLGRV